MFIKSIAEPVDFAQPTLEAVKAAFEELEEETGLEAAFSRRRGEFVFSGETEEVIEEERVASWLEEHQELFSAFSFKAQDEEDPFGGTFSVRL